MVLAKDRAVAAEAHRPREGQDVGDVDLLVELVELRLDFLREPDLHQEEHSGHCSASFCVAARTSCRAADQNNRAGAHASASSAWHPLRHLKRASRSQRTHLGRDADAESILLGRDLGDMGAGLSPDYS